VEHPDFLFLSDRRGNAGEPDLGRPDVDEAWTIRAGDQMSFDVTPAYDGWEMMGRLTFDVEIDETLAASLAQSARLTEGQLDFLATTGTHGITFTSTMDGTRLDARFIAQ
jgi:hypothetical protein